MSDHINLEIHYPGVAITRIDTVTVNSGELKVNREVILAVEISWDHGGYPPTPVPVIVAEFLRRDPTLVFGEHAYQTALHTVDHDQRQMQLRVKHMFQEPGEYYFRVTFGGHEDVVPAEYRKADGSYDTLIVTT